MCQRSNLLIFCLFFASAFAGYSQTVGLWAGSENAGRIRIFVNDKSQQVTVLYEVLHGWKMNISRLYVGKTHLDDLDSNPIYYPFSKEHQPNVAKYAYKIPYAQVYSYVYENGQNVPQYDGGVYPSDTIWVSAYAELEKKGTFTMCVDKKVKIPSDYVEDESKCPCEEGVKTVCKNVNDYQVCFNESCARNPVADAYSQWPGDHHALLIEGLGQDYDAVNGKFGENEESGTAYFTATFISKSDPNKVFEAEIWFEQRIGNNSNPLFQLDPSAYKAYGGPVDPETWHFYRKITKGQLIGKKDLNGLILDAQITGKPFQVGYGANGRNIRLGAATWLILTVTQQDYSGYYALKTEFLSDILFDMCCYKCEGECVNVPAADGFSQWPADYLVFWDPVLGKDYVPDPNVGVYWMVKSDGSASLFGTVKSLSNPGRILELSFSLTNKKDDVPDDQVLKQLLPSAYAPFGPVDPEDWHFYLSAQGTIKGKGDLEGLEFSVDLFEKTWQVGVGASGRNIKNGFSAWLKLTVLKRPEKGDWAYLEIQESSDIIGEFCCIAKITNKYQIAWGAGRKTLPKPGRSEYSIYIVPPSLLKDAGEGLIDEIEPAVVDPDIATRFVVGLTSFLTFLYVLWR